MFTAILKEKIQDFGDIEIFVKEKLFCQVGLNIKFFSTTVEMFNVQFLQFNKGNFCYKDKHLYVMYDLVGLFIKIMVMFQRITCGYVTTFIPNLSDWACKFNLNCHYSNYCTLPSRKKRYLCKKCVFLGLLCTYVKDISNQQ